MPELTLVVASANVDKAAEIVAILGTVPGITLVPRPTDVPDVDAEASADGPGAAADAPPEASPGDAPHQAIEVLRSHLLLF